MSSLEEWGWDDPWRSILAKLEVSEGAEYGRIIKQERSRWVVQLAAGPSPARITTSVFRGPHPVAGDWVVVEPGPTPTDPASLVAVLPRRSRISRGASGTGATEQVLAANVDTVWVVQGLDTPINLRRLERYLAIAWESGAVPEIVLTKADLAEDSEAIDQEIGAVAIGVQSHIVSVQRPESIWALRASLKAGRTVAILGPSGAGKSTLVNALGDVPVAETRSVREGDRKGRHTTTSRELFRISGGALLLDTPGLRELRLWDLEDGLGHAFPDIDKLASSCHFRDCQHEQEPGCAVLAAVVAGKVDPDRLESFRKLRAEAAHAERRDDPQARASAVAQHKTALKTLKYHPKYRRGN